MGKQILIAFCVACATLVLCTGLEQWARFEKAKLDYICVLE